MPHKALLFVAVGVGVLIAYVDSRPGWDDAGVTALAVLAGCGLLGLAAPARPWLWALAVGVWVPLVGILGARNYGALLALVFAFAGAYAGTGVRKLLARA